MGYIVVHDCGTNAGASAALPAALKAVRPCRPRPSTPPLATDCSSAPDTIMIGNAAIEFMPSSASHRARAPAERIHNATNTIAARLTIPISATWTKFTQSPDAWRRLANQSAANHAGPGCSINDSSHANLQPVPLGLVRCNFYLRFAARASRGDEAQGQTFWHGSESSGWCDATPRVSSWAARAQLRAQDYSRLLTQRCRDALSCPLAVNGWHRARTAGPSGP